MVVVPLSLGLIFVLLYFAFHSVGQALLIMVNVPLALIGGVVSLYLSGLYLSVPGSIGFIAVFGVAVLNGVVLVNAINQNLEGGMEQQSAILDGALSRLRPVLMTALTTMLGLIPLLYATGIGSEVQRPLATVVWRAPVLHVADPGAAAGPVYELLAGHPGQILNLHRGSAGGDRTAGPGSRQLRCLKRSASASMSALQTTRATP